MLLTNEGVQKFIRRKISATKGYDNTLNVAVYTAAVLIGVSAVPG